MLTPQQILDIIETLYPQIDELNVWITSDLIRRVMARLGRGEGVFLTASDEWQLEVYQAAGGHLDAVQREIKRWTKATDAEIKRIFEDAGIKALAYDSNFYIEHGLAGIELAQSENMIRLLEDTYQRTAGTVHNFTRTTAHASQQQLLNAYHKYEALADALDRDVQKADTRQAAASLKSELIMLASAASRAKLPSAPEGALLALAKEVIAVGRLYGYDGKGD